MNIPASRVKAAANRLWRSQVMAKYIRGKIITLSCGLVLSMATLANDAQTSPVTLNIGVRGDAKPFSYVDITQDSETILPGYSGYSVEICRHVLGQMQSLPAYRHLRFKASNIAAKDRFKQLGVPGKLFMLCGPDSITTDRLKDYRSSHAVFLSGMTYAYLNPRSPDFPRGDYCASVIGVVRGTTAADEGLKDIASRDLLMRFDKALDLELSKTSDRIESSWKKLRELTQEEVTKAQTELNRLDRLVQNQQKLSTEEETRHKLWRPQVDAITEMLASSELGQLDAKLNELHDQGNGRAGKILDFMQRQHQPLNKKVAREIITDECPEGFTSLPVRKYENHDRGIKAFCEGRVLYYLADYDILKHKTQEISECDVVMNRFTRSREVYGVFFPRNVWFNPVEISTMQDMSTADKQSGVDDKPDVQINVAGFYADFNHFLLMAMQGEHSEIERVFEKEFLIQEKSEQLSQFFDSFKINSP